MKHLPDSSLSVLLKTFNDIWETGNVPKSWKEARIIPVPKPGKDNTNPNNYRPIALTSCICKTLERMINERLVWYLETNNKITEFQSGFRHQRSTNDHLVRLEIFIREAFIKKEHLVAVFFDLEKAYDTTWKYGIMNDLHDIGLKGRLPVFVQNFLSNREPAIAAMHGPHSLVRNRGWSGGAMVLGKLPVPGRPTILITVGQGPTALAVGAGGGGLDIFTLIYPFSSFSLSLGDGPI